ncbi:MAG: hypothetical protein DMG82_06635 [Acidobacteria bacterium]|nr:MAG: hypothetical protein DMG82_06635 [Acidobacteriota bacterium]PYX47731.1 MAG: hypothetical protein DMG83_03645 [Acidobacteriota bacterium]
MFYLLASALRATGRDEEGKLALRRVGELHTNSIELDRKMHESMVLERDSSAAVSAAIGSSHDHPGEGETPSRQPARCRRYIHDVDSTLAGSLR